MTSALRHLQSKDSRLTRIIERIPVPKIHSSKNVFHDLISCIIEQQIHYRSTKKIFQKLLDKASINYLSLENFEEFERTALSSSKTSIKKLEAIANILDFWETKSINWEACSDDEIRKHLSSIKGVGAWTIDMILLYTLQRPNIFNYDDFHIKQMMTSIYGLNSKVSLRTQMKGIVEEWSPYKSMAFMYLLEYKKLCRQETKSPNS